MFDLGKTIDLVGKNLTRLRTLGVLILIIFFGLSIVERGLDKNEMEDLVEKITGLNVKKDILLQDVKFRDSLLLSKTDSIHRLRVEVSEANARVLNLSKANYTLQRKYEGISQELLRISSDSSYRFLNQVAYPFPGEKKYRFSEPQIKGMHKTYLEVDNLTALNENLEDQNSELLSLNRLNEALSEEWATSAEIMKSIRKDLEEVIETEEEKSKIKDRHDKRQKIKAVIKKIGVGALLVLAGFVAGGS